MSRVPEQEGIMGKTITHGAVYSASPQYRTKIRRGQHATDPIRAAAARLQAQGMSGEQAWAQVLKGMRP